MRVILLGDSADLDIVKVTGLAGFHNCRPEPVDSVLLVVSARNGPMPELIRTLNLVTGFEASRVGLLITEANRVDQELVQLVELEVRELLASMEVFASGIASRMSCFRTDDDGLIERVLAWTATPPELIRFSKAELLPDW